MNYNHFVEDINIIEDLFVQEEGDLEKLLRQLDLSEEEFEQLRGGEVEPTRSQLENIYNFAYNHNLFLNEITWQESIDEYNKGLVKAVTHGSRKDLEGEINLTANIEANNDFSYGFYLGSDIAQAGMWVAGEPNSSLYIFTLDKEDLVEATFYVDVEWMLAVSYFRHKIDEYAEHPMIKAIREKVEKCDYVYAPIADNKLFEVIDAFTEGEITDLQCLYAISATMLGYQYVLKSGKALSHLVQREHLYLCSVEKSLFNKEGDIETNTSMNKALIAKKRYENQGRYINEILGERILDESMLLEMAYTRQDAIDRCFSLGKKFIEHFDKIYNDTDEGLIHHWASEMQAWLNSVLSIRLKGSNKLLSKVDLIDWFFTVGALPEDFIKNEIEVDVYNDFMIDVIQTKNVIESLKNMGLLYD